MVTAWRVYVSAGATQLAVSAGSPPRLRVAVGAETQYEVTVEWSTGPPLPRYAVVSSTFPESWSVSSCCPPAESVNVTAVVLLSLDMPR